MSRFGSSTRATHQRNAGGSIGRWRQWADASCVLLPQGWAVTLAVAWTLSVCAGFAVLLRYENRPGVAASPPPRWPSGSRLERAAGQATLVMLLHPGCPCSRASLEELDHLLARCHGLVDAHVLFFKPSEFPDGWEQTHLWRKASAIPGVRPARDDDGVEADLFHAVTSGQVVIYDASGALLFSGGITPSRGHAGDNDGLRTAIALLTGTGSGATAQTPVFGCSIRDPGVDHTNTRVSDGR